MRERLMLLAVLCAAPGVALSQPYASGHLGWASADLPLGAPFNGVLDDGSLTYGFDVGMGFGERWAVEFGMNGYGDFDGRATPCPQGAACPQIVQDAEGDVLVYRFALVPRFEIGNVRLFGKVGYYRARIDTDIGLPDDDFRDNGLLLGAGVRVYVRDPWHVSVEAMRLDDNVAQIAVGFGWGLRFGAE